MFQDLVSHLTTNIIQQLRLKVNQKLFGVLVPRLTRLPQATYLLAGYFDPLTDASLDLIKASARSILS